MDTVRLYSAPGMPRDRTSPCEQRPTLKFLRMWKELVQSWTHYVGLARYDLISLRSTKLLPTFWKSRLSQWLRDEHLETQVKQIGDTFGA